MADFRRCIFALAVVALLTGLVSTASAQVTCTTQATPSFMRQEGLTELAGDLRMNCTNPNGANAGGNLLANISVFVPSTTITSRILNTANNASEILLMVDEPNLTEGAGPAPTAGVPVAGQHRLFVPCADPTQGANSTACSNLAGGQVANVFQGIISGPNRVDFIGIPVMPPGSTTETRVYRIVNLRVNANAVGGTLIGSTPVTAQIIVAGTNMQVNDSSQTVGLVQRGLTFSVRQPVAALGAQSGAFNYSQCSTFSSNAVRAVLRYEELFSTSIKARGPVSGTGDSDQNIPGTIYNTESGFGVPGIVGSGFTAARPGLADFGTRLRAQFNNIPTGVSIWVSTVNILGDAPATTSSAQFARLVSSEAAAAGSFTIPTDTLRSIAQTAAGSGSSIPAAQIAISGNAATAAWEVLNATTLSSDRYEFYFYFASTPSPATNTPAAGVTATISGSYAPIYNTTTTPAAAQASAGLPIPRFVDLNTASNFFQFSICRTNLLFPFLTNMAGFDTGVAISNTTTDIFGTAAQAGVCTLNFFGANQPAAVTTESVASGTTYANTVSSMAPNFQGYMIAQCNFQLAHGFAYVQSAGGNAAMGYLALIIPDQADGRRSTGISLTGTGTGEVLGQ